MACVGLSHCFGAGMNQMMLRAGQSNPYGQASSFGGSTTNLAASMMPSVTVGQGATARSYKNFYSHAYDESGRARIPNMGMANLAAMGGMGGMGGMAGMAGMGGMGMSGYGSMGGKPLSHLFKPFLQAD